MPTEPYVGSVCVHCSVIGCYVHSVQQCHNNAQGHLLENRYIKLFCLFLLFSNTFGISC